MKNIKFQNQLITILITFILILGCDPESIMDNPLLIQINQQKICVLSECLMNTLFKMENP